MANGEKASAVDWSEVMSNEAVSEVSRYALPNESSRFTEEDDARMLENARRQAPLMGRILAMAIQEAE